MKAADRAWPGDPALSQLASAGSTPSRQPAAVGLGSRIEDRRHHGRTVPPATDNSRRHFSPQTAEERYIVACSLDGDGPPWRELRLGPDHAGNLLEIVVLLLDDDTERIIQATRMRPKCRELLP